MHPDPEVPAPLRILPATLPPPVTTSEPGFLGQLVAQYVIVTMIGGRIVKGRLHGFDATTLTCVVEDILTSAQGYTPQTYAPATPVLMYKAHIESVFRDPLR